MVISRMLASIAAASVGAFAASQTLPPPDLGGQSYWFGPGPQSFSIVSSGQSDGGYGEMYKTGAVFVTGVNGGPAFNGDSSNGTNRTHTYNVTTNVSVAPYIYVDGYFGITATLVGNNLAGSLNIGSSRFFVLHNTPIDFAVNSFTNLVNSGSSFIVYYDFTWTNYTASTSLSTSQVIGGQGTSFSLMHDPSVTGGILQVDIQRTIVPSSPLAIAGNYTASGSVLISSL